MRNSNSTLPTFQKWCEIEIHINNGEKEAPEVLLDVTIQIFTLFWEADVCQRMSKSGGLLDIFSKVSLLAWCRLPNKLTNV